MNEMPSAPQWLCDRMEKRFGGLDDAAPRRFLQVAGYKLTPDWRWEPKLGVTTYNDMTQDEYDCLAFLVLEWDYGGLAIGAEDV